MLTTIKALKFRAYNQSSFVILFDKARKFQNFLITIL